ncbi:MAG TPA: VWA domain-containing protein [Blastocatellia bacterium]|jgi:Mg-chelatase subunit ChlD|nr:VWA domain-containing protein [Blastocatellia bacterium]
MSLSTYKGLPANFKVILSLLLLLFAITDGALAQQGASSAAAARARYLSEMGSLPASREVAVEEFVNYHRHQIGSPKADEAVALDVRWGNDQAPGPGQEAILQIGFSTALATDRQQLRPVNLALVIDKSGSMADADKISRVKSALLALVSRLRETDTLSIVVFDTDAQVLLPARSLTDRGYIKQLIRDIAPGGATNIHAGLMLGYSEVRKNYRENATNRVILLTDGIANRGETEPEKIARDSQRFNDQGIDLSTIGVGLDLNKDLLRELAKSGRGLFHFVADSEDIEKVFVKELQSLVAPVAYEPNVDIVYDPALELDQVYGYEPQLRKSGVKIKLDNMNQGLTQVVLLRFRLAKKSAIPSSPSVNVRLSYYDPEQKEQVIKIQEALLTVTNGRLGDMLKDPEVGKNYSIAQLAQAIRDMAAACEERRYQEAENLLAAAIDRTYQRYPHLEDADITRTLTIAQNYRNQIRKYKRQWDAQSDR